MAAEQSGLNKVIKIVIVLVLILALILMTGSIGRKTKESIEGSTGEQKASAGYTKCLVHCQTECPTFDCKTSSGDSAVTCPEDFYGDNLPDVEERKCSIILENLRKS